MNNSDVQTEWQNTAEGLAILKHFFNSKSSGRKLFGILERPVLHTSIEEVCYKIVLLGKSGSGKTWTCQRLAGISGNFNTYETVGISITDIYWPIKIWDKIIIFKLTIWDPGSNSFKKYTHIPWSCNDKADMQLLIFSYNDLSSFNEILPMINKSNKKSEETLPGILLIGNRYFPKNEVTISDLQEIKLKNNINILTLPNFTTNSNEITKISPILNAICEQLWFRDQQYILSHNVTV
ncbi:hypothetical protein O3M35_004595 [Rhynocoris fuscipes]|uniref:Ciliogenesis and planar polarity effector 2 n=1 Tax=Rhynocoris fuscipes TaxID=488301 RepID=A0AAW1CKD0_9HEMI